MGKKVEEIIMNLLLKNSKLSINDIAKKTKLSKTYLYETIWKLENKGLIKKVWENGRFVWMRNS